MRLRIRLGARLLVGWGMLTPSLRILAVLFAAVAATGSASPADLPPAPVARQTPVIDDYFGTRVTDPYRWMESANSPELATYLKLHSERTRAVLDAIPGRAALAARIEALADTINTASGVEKVGNLVFYEKISPGSSLSVLHVREGFTGPDRVLVNPSQSSTSTTHQAISYWFPSNDGSHVAVGLSTSGSEDAVIHILETKTGKELPETLHRARFGVTSWSVDGKGLYYVPLQTLPPGAPLTDKNKNLRTYLHRLGTDPASDVAVFGAGVSPDVAVDPSDDARLVMPEDGPYAFGLLIHGVRRELTVYRAAKSDVERLAPKWVKIVDVDDGVTGLDWHGHSLFLLTHKGAPRSTVIEVDLDHPDIGAARTLIAPGERVIQALTCSSEALYVKQLDGGIGRISRVDWDGHVSEVPLPLDGTISHLSTDSKLPGFVVQLEGWTVSPLWYAYDPVSGAVTDTHLDSPSPVDFSGIVSEEVKVRASDGVMIPLSIIRARTTKLDGTNPTLLYAYGSYGINSSPAFSALRLAWFERGGIYAIAHVRGGGEYGEEWHLAGKGVNKMKTITDFIDCARWLVARGYTSPSRLGARGGSAGGITMGGAIAQAPDLFAAVLDEIPVSDQLRIELSPNGPANVPEFGSVKTPEGFKILYATSPVHHLKPGTPYPAVMLVTGANDPRVDPWQPAKMAATLVADSTSGKPILLRVDYQGGHGLIGATKAQAAQLAADEYSFLLWQMGVPGYQR